MSFATHTQKATANWKQALETREAAAAPKTAREMEAEFRANANRKNTRELAEFVMSHEMVKHDEDFKTDTGFNDEANLRAVLVAVLRKQYDTQKQLKQALAAIDELSQQNARMAQHLGTLGNVCKKLQAQAKGQRVDEACPFLD